MSYNIVCEEFDALDIHKQLGVLCDFLVSFFGNELEYTQFQNRGDAPTVNGDLISAPLFDHLMERCADKDDFLLENLVAMNSGRQ